MLKILPRLSFVLAIVCCLTAVPALAQNSLVTWGNGEDDNIDSVVGLADGSVLVIGQTDNGDIGAKDLVVTKVSASLDIIWSKVIGGTSDECGTSCKGAEAPDGSLYIVGETGSCNTNSKTLLIKLSPAGGLEWTKNLGATSSHDHARDVLVDSNNDVVIVGSTENNSFGSSDGFIAKYSDAGVLLWASRLGAGDDDHFVSVVEQDNGVYYCFGSSESFGLGREMIVVAIDQGGAVVFSKKFAMPGSQSGFEIESFDGVDMICSGYHFSPSRNGFLIRINGNCDIVWAKACTTADDLSFSGLAVSGNEIQVSANRASGGEHVEVYSVQGNGDLIGAIEPFVGYNLEKEFWCQNMCATGGKWFCGATSVVGTDEQFGLIEINSDEDECSVEPDHEWEDIDVPVSDIVFDIGVIAVPTQVNISIEDFDFVFEIESCPNPDCGIESEFTIQNGCVGESLSLENLSTVIDGNDTVFEWEVIGGASYSGWEPEIIIPEEGTFEITLIVVDNSADECSSEFTLEVEVFGELDEEVVVSDALICPGTTFEFTAPVIDQFGFEVEWMDGSSGDSYTTGFVGQHYLLIHNLCDLDTVFFNVEIIDIVAPELPDTVFVCPTESWFFDIDGWDQILINGEVVVLPFEFQGQDTYVIDMILGECSIQDQIVLVESDPFDDCPNTECEIEALFEISDACVGDVIDLNNLSTVIDENGWSLEWVLDGATTYSEWQPLIVIDADGTHEITLTIIDDFIEGCLAEFTAQFDVFGEIAEQPSIDDALLCPGETVEFELPVFNQFGTTVAWSDGSSDDILTIDESGQYFLQFENPCSSYTVYFDVEIIELPFVEIPDTVQICQDESWQLSIGGIDQVSVNGDLLDLPTELTEEGSYLIEYSFEGCQLSENLELVEYQNELSLSAYVCLSLANFEDHLTCELCDSLEIEIGDSSQDGNIQIYVTANGVCGEIEQTYLVAQSCDCPYYVPNTFTPNEDGVNDVFRVETSCEFKSFRFSIYNRWGEIIFDSMDQHQPWTGAVKGGGHYAPDGIYTWVLMAISDTGELKTINEKGHVALIGR